MTTENALPTATEATAGTQQAEASAETKALNAAIDSAEGENQDNTEAAADKPKEEAAPKKEKTQEEREIARLRRRVDNLTRRLYEGKSRGDERQLTPQAIEDDNRTQQRDNEPLSLSRQELQELIDKEARKLAPTIKQQEAEIEHRRSVVTKLATDLGKEKFDALASDLDDALDGLTANGRPTPAADAIFGSEDPRALIEYLADPDNADEAEAIGRMSAVQAGRAIARLDTKLASKKAQAKPQPSKAPPPIEDIRGQGAPKKSLFDLSDAEFMKRRREQVKNRR